MPRLAGDVYDQEFQHSTVWMAPSETAQISNVLLPLVLPVRFWFQEKEGARNKKENCKFQRDENATNLKM
jgi:hypothetical protein